jgi:hypothetical protein
LNLDAEHPTLKGAEKRRRSLGILTTAGRQLKFARPVVSQVPFRAVLVSVVNSYVDLAILGGAHIELWPSVQIYETPEGLGVKFSAVE